VSDKLLDIEVRLLLLRHGRPKVLQALARLSEQTIEDLEKQLRTAEQKPRVKRSKSSTMDLLASECQEHPEIAETLRVLVVAFENRTFLPHLRDVQRFLDRISVSSEKLRSRAAAAPFLIRALAKLPPADLARLGVTDKSVSESDYSLLARAIMNSPATKGSDSTEAEDKTTG